MIIKVIILAVLLIPVPLLIGTLWTGAAVPQDGSWIRAYLFGLFTMLALFQLLAVPMCFGRMSLKLLARIYTVCLLCLSAAALVRRENGSQPVCVLLRRSWRRPVPACFCRLRI